MAAKIYQVRDYGPEALSPYLMIHCPGCGDDHCISVKVHQWNGSLDKPTLRPSLLHTSAKGTCHSWVTDGQIQFLADCFHTLRGKTVDLPDWETQEQQQEKKQAMANQKFNRGDAVTLTAASVSGLAARVVLETQGAYVCRIEDPHHPSGHSHEGSLVMFTAADLEPRKENEPAAVNEVEL